MKKSVLRGLALSIMLYCGVTSLLILVVILCGGDFYQIPGFLFLVIGACTGVGASIIDDKLD